MYDFAVTWDWIEFVVRWLHVITAIVWIGTSFYFIALDLGLRKGSNLPEGVHGEEWQVHGGGFYHVRKYLVAPEHLPEHLTWFKWESYSTWISGAALLMIIYWVGGEVYLLDPSKADMSLQLGILISAASLAAGWIVYDQLCKSRLSYRPTFLMILLFAILVAMSWGYQQIFTGRATLLHLGAFTATIMTANVFFIIIPNQRIVVDDLKNGRAPDPEFGRIAKLRSTHNNYLTLPVVFLMLSIHYPLAFATEYNWIIASLVFLVGVAIRHYFNAKHARTGNPTWAWAVAALLIICIAWLSTANLWASRDEAASRPLANNEMRFATADGFQDAYRVVVANCSMCHAREPTWDGMHWAPAGVLLETESDVARNARSIHLQAGASRAMPPPSATFLDDSDRQLLVRWYRAANSDTDPVRN